MPRALASLGPCTFTGWPAKKYSPSSKAWMPAMPLMRVLLPAPLSPTSAVTWPGRTSRSTPRSTCTAPKLFWMPRRLSIGSTDADCPDFSGASTDTGFSSSRVWAGASGWEKGPGARPVGTGPRSGAAGAARAASGLLQAGLVARGLEVRGAHVGELLVAVVEDLLHVLGGDGDRRRQRGRDVLAQLGVRHRTRGQRVGLLLVTLDQGDRQVRGGLGLELDVLVDGHALVAGEDGLQALHRGVLAGDGNVTVAAHGLEAGDDAAGHGVVGGDHAVDLAVVLGVELLERRAGLRGVPEAALVTDELVVAGVHLGLEGGLVALLEQRGVVVARVTVDLHDVRRGLVGGVEAVDEALALQVADLDVVEREVVAS